jgi:hypothetical protein
MGLGFLYLTPCQNRFIVEPVGIISFPTVKLPDHDSNQSPLHVVEVKNTWSTTCILYTRPHSEKFLGTGATFYSVVAFNRCLDILGGAWYFLQIFTKIRFLIPGFGFKIPANPSTCEIILSKGIYRTSSYCCETDDFTGKFKNDYIFSFPFRINPLIITLYLLKQITE